jgi:hypothetical protein
VTNRSWWAQFWSALAGRAGLHQPCRAALIDALAQIEAQGAVIRQVQQLHKKTSGMIIYGGLAMEVCSGCSTTWPCPTAQAMGVFE